MYSKVIQLYIHVYPFFQILFHYSLLQDIEYSSLCYTVNACCLSILYLAVCINPILPIYPSPPSPQRGIFARKVSSWNPRAGYLSRPMRVRMSHGTQAAICLSVCLWLRGFPSLLVSVHLLPSVSLSGCPLLPFVHVRRGCPYITWPFGCRAHAGGHVVLPHSRPPSLGGESDWLSLASELVPPESVWPVEQGHLLQEGGDVWPQPQSTHKHCVWSEHFAAASHLILTKPLWHRSCSYPIL